MHVLSIVHYPIFGGPHNRNMRLAPILAKQAIKTTLLLPDEPGNAVERLQSAGIDIVQLPLLRMRAASNFQANVQMLASFPAQIRRIRQVIKDLHVDIVQLNGFANPHGAIAANAAGVPVVWQILDTFTPVALRRILAPVVRRYADVVMCTGMRVAREHPGVTRRPEQLITFYPPVDISIFKANPATRFRARQRLGIDAPLVIGTVGNINPQKGHDNFIRAAARVKAKIPGAKFLILGATYENHRGYLEDLQMLATKLGLKLGCDLIMFDPTGQVHEVVQALDIFWMTPRPRSEGIPTAMEEAMAVALPVVSFEVGSIGELVEHGRTGYLVQKQDAAAIAENTLQHLLDPRHRAVMGFRAREFVEKHASLAACAERHMLAYELARRTANLVGIRDRSGVIED